MSTTPRAAVAANVRAEIARAGVKRREVAGALGMSYESLSRRLAGKVAFDVDDLHGLAELLDVPAARLLGGGVAA